MQEGTANLTLLFFSWWYKYLPYRLFSACKALLITLTDLFSVKMILPTLFAPWKRDILSYEGLTLQQKFQVMMLNLASRIIGFLVKVSVFCGYLLMISISLAVILITFALWLAFPLAIIGLIIFGLINVFSHL